MRNSNTIDLRRFWRVVKRIKWLYVVASILCVGAAGFYVSRSLKKVPIIGEMLIGEESMTDGGAGALAAAKGAGGMSQMLKTFSIGGFGGAAVDNELMVISSHDVMLRTVKNLSLNRSYIGKTANGKKALLWQDTPIKIEAPAEYFDTLSVGFTVKVTLNDNGKVDLRAYEGLLRKTLCEAKDVTLPAMLSTPYGKLQVLKGESFKNTPYKQVTVGVTGNSAAATRLSTTLTIGIASKLSDVIDISLDYPNPELGKAIVNGVMDEYNTKRLDRVHETAVNSIKYYDERIAQTLSQLESAEKQVADYKRSTSMSAIEAEAKIIAEMTTEGQAEVVAAKHTIDYYQQVLKALEQNLNSDILIPQLATVSDTTISAYNSLVMKRREIRRSATDDNEALMLINQNVSTMGDLIKESARQRISKAKADLDLKASLTGMANRRLGQYPEMEMDYTVLARNQEFQNALYLYLVQARENAVLKLYADTDLGYVFQPAYVAKAGFPIKSFLLIFGALLFALFGCTLVALIILAFSKNVIQPSDIAFLGIEPRTIDGVKNMREAADHMRTLLLAKKNPKIIYCADFSENQQAQDALLDSFSAADIPVERVTSQNNSELLSPAVSDAIRGFVESGNFVFAPLKEPQNVFMLENSIYEADAVLLTIVPQSMRRDALKRYLKGQTVGKTYAFIVGS